MPIFNTPITTDDRSLSKVLSQKLPVAVFLYDSRQPPDKPLEDALNEVARKYVGELLVARVDIASNPNTHRQYGSPQTPALVTLPRTFVSRKVKSQAEAVRPADIHAHIDYLLGKGPLPGEDKAEPAGAPSQGAAHVTDASFQKAVLESKIPVFVDFWAPWCRPCLSVGPLIEQLAGEYAGRVKIVKLNTDENRRTSDRFQIHSIPTFITFRDGKQVERRSGASAQIIKAIIEEVLL